MTRVFQLIAQSPFVYSCQLLQPGKALGVLKDINTDIANTTFTVDDYKATAREQYYLRKRVEQYKAMQTGMKYLQQFQFADPYIFGYFSASKDIRDIRQADIALWTENLIKYSKKGKLGGKAKKNIVGILLSVLNYNHSVGVIPERLIFPRIDIEKKKKDIPDIADSFKIISAIDVTDEERLIYIFLITHPCRLSEARALQSVDFDFERQTVTIQRSLEGTAEKNTNKTEIVYTIPLHPGVAERIRQLCILREPTETIFKFQEKTWTDGTLRRKWNDATVKTGLKYQLYRGLKHACLSELANQSGEIRNAQKMAGHTTSTMTEEYTQRTDIEKLRAVQSLIVLPDGL
jgi:integrase